MEILKNHVFFLQRTKKNAKETYRINIMFPNGVAVPFPRGIPGHTVPSLNVICAFQMYVSDFNGIPLQVPSHASVGRPSASILFVYHTTLPHWSKIHNSYDAKLYPCGLNLRTPAA